MSSVVPIITLSCVKVCGLDVAVSATNLRGTVGTHTIIRVPRLRCSPSTAAPLWSGLARRATATRSGAWLLGACTSVRSSCGRHAQYVLVVLLHAPLQVGVAVLDKHVWLEGFAGERAQAVAVAEHREDGGPLV